MKIDTSRFRHQPSDENILFVPNLQHKKVIRFEVISYENWNIRNIVQNAYLHSFYGNILRENAMPTQRYTSESQDLWIF